MRHETENDALIISCNFDISYTMNNPKTWAKQPKFQKVYFKNIQFT